MNLLTLFPKQRQTCDPQLGSFGPDLFRRACEFGLRDSFLSIATGPIVADHRSIGLRWTNRKHPAMSRVMEAFA